MTVAAGDFFLITAVGEAFNQRIMLTHTLRVDAVNVGVTENAASLGLLVAVANGVGDGNLIESAYLACLPDNYVLRRWTCQKIWPTRYRQYNYIRDVNGTHGEGAETANLAGVLTMQTRIAGRGEQGNKHIGPLPHGPTSVDEGLLVAAYKTLLTTLGTKLYADIPVVALGLVCKPIVLHRELDDEGHIINMTSTDIFTAAVQDTIRVMRRRTVGLGI